MRTNTSRGLVAATAIALVLVVSACGSDGGSDKADADKPTTTVATTDSTTAGGSTTAAFTADELCAKITADLVGSALGLDIGDPSSAAASVDAPPTCTYPYQTSAGKDAAVTISVLRPIEMGGKTGAEGYDTYVGINKAIAANVDYEEQPVDAGREAVRFTGEATHAAIADTGTAVVQLSVPVDDAKGEQVDALLIKVVDALS